MVEKQYCIAANRLTCDWVPPPDQILAQNPYWMDRKVLAAGKGTGRRKGTGGRERYWRQGKVLAAGKGTGGRPG